MDLIKRLEKRARELDQSVRSSGGYNQQAADDRDLLEETIKVLNKLVEIEALHLIRSGQFERS